MFNIYHADCLGREGNCLYPHKVDVTDAESLKQAVIWDYVCAAYQNNYRSKANFLRSNCLAVEFDNDHSENPEDWITPEDVRAAFPGVTIGIHYSRNNQKVKNGKPARRKFLCNETLLLQLMLLKDLNGNYIWKPSLDIAKPDTILGRPIYTSGYMPAIIGNAT